MPLARRARAQNAYFSKWFFGAFVAFFVCFGTFRKACAVGHFHISWPAHGQDNYNLKPPLGDACFCFKVSAYNVTTGTRYGTYATTHSSLPLHNSAKFHPSRHLSWHTGIIFCCKYGYYGSGEEVKLTQECHIRPPNAVQRGRARRLLKGKVPKKNRQWPELVGAKCLAG